MPRRASTKKPTSKPIDLESKDLFLKLDSSDAVKAIELEPTWPKGYSRKGAALVGLNRLEEAKIAYEESLKLDPNNAATKAEVESLKNKLSGPGGSQPMGNPFGGNPAEIFQKLATDPRTKSYMSDPSYMAMLQELSANPSNAMKVKKISVISFL